jgi:hypothetical protein
MLVVHAILEWRWRGDGVNMIHYVIYSYRGRTGICIGIWSFLDSRVYVLCARWVGYWRDKRSSRGNGQTNSGTDGPDTVLIGQVWSMDACAHRVQMFRYEWYADDTPRTLLPDFISRICPEMKQQRHYHNQVHVCEAIHRLIVAPEWDDFDTYLEVTIWNFSPLATSYTRSHLVTLILLSINRSKY